MRWDLSSLVLLVVSKLCASETRGLGQPFRSPRSPSASAATWPLNFKSCSAFSFLFQTNPSSHTTQEWWETLQLWHLSLPTIQKAVGKVTGKKWHLSATLATLGHAVCHWLLSGHFEEKHVWGNNMQMHIPGGSVIGQLCAWVEIFLLLRKAAPWGKSPITRSFWEP